MCSTTDRATWSSLPTHWRMHRIQPYRIASKHIQQLSIEVSGIERLAVTTFIDTQSWSKTSCKRGNHICRLNQLNYKELIIDWFNFFFHSCMCSFLSWSTDCKIENVPEQGLTTGCAIWVLCCESLAMSTLRRVVTFAEAMEEMDIW